MRKLWNNLLTVWLAALLLLGGCRASLPEPSGGTYSNLADAASRDWVSRQLEQAGIPKENVQSWLEEVTAYLQVMDAASMVEKGFAPLEGLPKYDEGLLLEKWEKKYPMWLGINCRITALQLMQGLVTVARPERALTHNLLLDQSALSCGPKQLFDDAQAAVFNGLFTSVPVRENSEAAWVQAVSESWDSLGISVDQSCRASLIFVMFYTDLEPDAPELFVGHAGVLVPAGEGKLLFVEKVNFSNPYQAVVLDGRQALYDYLMESYEISVEDYSLRPLLLENGRPLNPAGGVKFPAEPAP